MLSPGTHTSATNQQNNGLTIDPNAHVAGVCVSPQCWCRLAVWAPDRAAWCCLCELFTARSGADRCSPLPLSLRPASFPSVRRPSFPPLTSHSLLLNLFLLRKLRPADWCVLPCVASSVKLLHQLSSPRPGAGFILSIICTQFCSHSLFIASFCKTQEPLDAYFVTIPDFTKHAISVFNVCLTLRYCVGSWTSSRAVTLLAADDAVWMRKSSA